MCLPSLLVVGRAKSGTRFDAVANGDIYGVTLPRHLGKI